MNKKTSAWLQCFDYCPESLYRVICFPHAGGTASFFRTWGKQLTDCEMYGVRYPGRGERIDEPLPTDLRNLAFQIAEAIKSISDLPVVLFGHSMGAAIALETARQMEANGISVAHLFASGSKQGMLPPKSVVPEEDDETICKELIEMGGTSPDVIMDPIFQELALPAVRSDGKMFHAYEMEIEPPLKCQITTICGDDDIHSDIRPWNKLTLKGYQEKHVSGDHFYLISNPPFRVLQECLQKQLLQNH